MIEFAAQFGIIQRRCLRNVGKRSSNVTRQMLRAVTQIRPFRLRRPDEGVADATRRERLEIGCVIESR